MLLKFCPILLNGGNSQGQSHHYAELVAFALGPYPLPFNRAIPVLWQNLHTVGCLTYPHSHARPIPSLTSPGYGLPLTATIPFSRLMNIERPSRLEPRTFLIGTHALTTRINALPTELLALDKTLQSLAAACS